MTFVECKMVQEAVARTCCHVAHIRDEPPDYDGKPAWL